MTSGGQKPALGFTHRRDASLLLMTPTQCTSRTKPRFFQNIRLPEPRSAATILGFCTEKRTKTSSALARHDKPRCTKGTPRAWGESLHPAPRGSARLGRTNRAATHQRPHPCQPSSALMPTHIGANAEPVLSLLHLLLRAAIYLWGTPRGPILQPDRNPPLVRDFHLLIPALRD